MENISLRGKSKLNKDKDKDKDKDKEGRRGRGRGQRSSEDVDEDAEVVEDIDGILSTDAILRRKRKRRKTHKLGDDSLASIGLDVDDSGPVFKRSRDAVKGTSYALSKYLSNSHRSGDSAIVGSKDSRSDSSLDTLLVRTTKRTKGTNSILCKMAGKATGTGIRARVGARAGTGAGAGAKIVKEKAARSKAQVTVTRSDNDQDVRCVAINKC